MPQEDNRLVFPLKLCIIYILVGFPFGSLSCNQTTKPLSIVSQTNKIIPPISVRFLPSLIQYRTSRNIYIFQIASILQCIGPICNAVICPREIVLIIVNVELE